MSRPFPSRGRVASVALSAALLGSTLVAGSVLLAGPATATTINYAGSTSGTQSTLVIHRGDTFQRVLHPTGSITATLDDTNRTVTAGKVQLAPTTTETFVGPFGIKVYVKAEITQIGESTGTATPGAVPGTSAIAVSAKTRLALTVFLTADGTQHPETDGKITTPAKCYVDLDLSLKGTAHRRTGALAIAADPFTIPQFPTGTPDPLVTCGLATPSLNQQLAGANNAINLNFTGGPTTAHYTGVSKGTQSTIVIKKGSTLFERTVHPTGSLVADINFATGAVSNVVTRFDPIVMRALPGILSNAPADAKVALTVLGVPTASLSPGTSPGIDKVTVAAKVRMGVTISAFNSTTLTFTNPAKCYVDVDLKLAGTVDRGTDVLNLKQNGFTIPSFPILNCNLLGPAITKLVSGSVNTADLTYVDGVVPGA